MDTLTPCSWMNVNAQIDFPFQRVRSMAAGVTDRLWSVEELIEAATEGKYAREAS
jgi:hypothetical protein